MANDSSLPLVLVVQRLYNSIREFVLADINQLIGNTIIGGKINGSTISGTIPSTALPLTTEGDILIYKNGALQRLGIGTAGQLLTVVSGYPAWVTGTSTPTSNNVFVDDNGVPATLQDNAGVPNTLNSD